MFARTAVSGVLVLPAWPAPGPVPRPPMPGSTVRGRMVARRPRDRHQLHRAADAALPDALRGAVTASSGRVAVAARELLVDYGSAVGVTPWRGTKATAARSSTGPRVVLKRPASRLRRFLTARKDNSLTVGVHPRNTDDVSGLTSTRGATDVDTVASAAAACRGRPVGPRAATGVRTGR